MCSGRWISALWSCRRGIEATLLAATADAVLKHSSEASRSNTSKFMHIISIYFSLLDTNTNDFGIFLYRKPWLKILKCLTAYFYHMIIIVFHRYSFKMCIICEWAVLLTSFVSPSHHCWYDQVPPQIDLSWSSNKPLPACGSVSEGLCECERVGAQRRGPLRCTLLRANLAYKRKMRSSPVQPAANGIQQVPEHTCELSVLSGCCRVVDRTVCAQSVWWMDLKSPWIGKLSLSSELQKA